MIFVWALKFYHKPVRSCSILSKKKARFYAGCGVSQTPMVKQDKEVSLEYMKIFEREEMLIQQGLQQGRQEEQINTERERQRAEQEKKRADQLEEELQRLKKLLNQ